ncbi:Sporulation protein YpjB (SpoYpjB) [Halobacillus alkaliphilus]|uniref:Sporulation protein YpjB (SpoYpjB) n=1 Tax=Halobacillus alkaliphilus TaxID=396056 RepID=A0A1I2K5H0_9BACI|nr:sporulation protein YpjB [Halobacillus alkaliphilus]SFF61683.1 Sporulation protein YpjB (SpoYpjB) [Halobacillus alkaliphilus]
MGRAILILLCSVIFTLTPMNKHLYLSGHSEDWTVFFLQYKLLIQDGKYELASKALNNRRTELENYLESLSPQKEEIGKELLQSVVTSEQGANSADADRLFIFIETVNPTNYLENINNLVFNYKKNLDADSYLTDEELQNEWEKVVPSLLTYYSYEQLIPIGEQLSQLSDGDSYQIRETMAVELDQLPEALPALSGEALLWTVLLIGGTILITLAYVAARKYQAIAIVKGPIKRENS